MKSTKRLLAYLCVSAALAQLPHFACQNPLSKDDGGNTEAMTALAAGLFLNQLEIAGAYNFFDGTNGNTNNGPYDLSGGPTQYTRSQTFTGFSPTTGNIVEYDNTRRVFFEYVTSASSGASYQKFLWYRWTVSGGKAYICPDLNGAAATLAASKTEFDSVAANPGTTANVSMLGDSAVCGTTGGCGGWCWSRLDRR